MMRFLRHIFQRKRRKACDNADANCDYDAETQEMILSSFDLLELIEDRGEDLQSERVVSHFFVGDDDDIQRASRFFEHKFYLIGAKESNRLEIVERSILNTSWVERTIPFMLQTSGEFELEYDGWDCGQALGPSDQLFIR